MTPWSPTWSYMGPRSASHNHVAAELRSQVLVGQTSFQYFCRMIAPAGKMTVTPRPESSIKLLPTASLMPPSHTFCSTNTPVVPTVLIYPELCCYLTMTRKVEQASRICRVGRTSHANRRIMNNAMWVLTRHISEGRIN